MLDRDHDRDASSVGPALTRRQALKLAGGGAAGAGIGRVVYEYTGFGTVTGTNVTEQSLGPMARRRLEPTPFTLDTAAGSVAFDGETAELRTDADDRVAAVSIRDGASPEASERRPEPLAELAVDLGAVSAGEFAFEFTGYEGFFERIRGARVRPFTVAALRGERYREPSREAIREFTGAGLDDPAALVDGLADGFTAHTHFDVARYVAASIEDHLLFGTVQLGEPFRESADFEAILDGVSGLYCYQYALRSIEAFHAGPPHRQSVPVFCGIVLDHRHNHVYTALASVVRDEGGLLIPMTFLDYYYAALFDNLGLTWAFGEGIGAYDGYHRVTDIHYRNVYNP